MGALRMIECPAREVVVGDDIIRPWARECVPLRVIAVDKSSPPYIYITTEQEGGFTVREDVKIWRCPASENLGRRLREMEAETAGLKSELHELRGLVERMALNHGDMVDAMRAKDEMLAAMRRDVDDFRSDMDAIARADEARVREFMERYPRMADVILAVENAIATTPRVVVSAETQ